MKKFIGKTKEEAIEIAAKELSVPTDMLYVVDEKVTKGLFGKVKSVEITCYTDSMVIEFVLNYLKDVIEKIGLEVNQLTPSFSEGLIRVKISTNHNSIIIGKNGRTLQAINEICRCAASSTFQKRVRILLDVNEYKEEKYKKIIYIAKKEANKVLKTKITAELEHMSSDERRIIHNTLKDFKNIKTVSVGEGKNRHITIQYVENK